MESTHNLIELHADDIRGAANAKDEHFIEGVKNQLVHVLLARQTLQQVAHRRPRLSITTSGMLCQKSENAETLIGGPSRAKAKPNPNLKTLPSTPKDVTITQTHDHEVDRLPQAVPLPCSRVPFVQMNEPKCKHKLPCFVQSPDSSAAQQSIA